MKRIMFGIVAVGIVAASLWAADSDKKMDRTALEQAFADKLSGSLLSGSFSLDGKNAGGNKPDKYRIVSAKKMQGDDWVITAKMKIGDNELDIPVPIKVYWADDTPVMSLTDLTIPGMGTFTSRVMFYGTRYAGTWQHGDAGGHMWGVVEKPPKSEVQNWPVFRPCHQCSVPRSVVEFSFHFLSWGCWQSAHWAHPVSPVIL